MNVICYGDSNTYGYDPRSYFGGRYRSDCRWVDILAARTHWDVHNNGMNGREIPRRETIFPKSTDLLIVMLGTNDILQGSTPEQAAARMEAFLTQLPLDKGKILLIAPPPLQRGEWVENEDMIESSVRLASCYQGLAERTGIRFLDAGDWPSPRPLTVYTFPRKATKLLQKRLSRR